MRKAFGIAASLLLLTSALLHAVWLVSPWPWASWEAFSKAFVLSDETYRIPTMMMLVVALLWLAAAYVVAAFAGLAPRVGPAWIFRLGIWVIASILLARGTIGMISMTGALGDPLTPESFRATLQMYVFVYLPIWLAIGLLTAACAIARAPLTAQ